MVKFCTLLLWNFMKNLFLTLLFSPLLFSDIVGGIALTVDGEPITLYEIKQEQELSQQNVKKTVDILIRTKLEKIEAKNRNVTVTNAEVLEDLKKMAEQNNMSLSQLYETMSSSRHLSESQTKEKTKEKLRKQKLFDAIAMSQMEEPTQEELEEYYKLHLAEYQMPKSIDTMVYTSSDKDALERKISNPMINLPSVQMQNQTIEMAKVNPQLAQLLINTKNGSFTQILPPMAQNQGYMAFYIMNKNDVNTPALALVQNQIQASIMNKKRDQVLSEHFQRMRMNADIKVLRLPEE